MNSSRQISASFRFRPAARGPPPVAGRPVAQAAIKAEQHFAEPIELRRKWSDFVRIREAKGHRDRNLGLDFESRAACDRYKSSKVSWAKPATPFGNIRRNRNRGSAQLRDESEFLLGRKHSRGSVDVDHDLHSELPHIQISVGLDPGGVRSSHSRERIRRASPDRHSAARVPPPAARRGKPPPASRRPPPCPMPATPYA